MKKFILLSLICVVAIGQSLFAQSVDLASINSLTDKENLSQKSSMSPFGLIDFSRIKWSNSYSINFISSGNNSMSLGVLNTQLAYEFSSKLSMAINLGLAHNAGSLVNNGDADATILPGFSLDFHPSEKFRMNISFQTYRGMLGSNGMNNYYLNNWGRDPFYSY